MLWKLFSSDERVMRALEQSTGYDISPNSLSMAANNDEPVQTVEDSKPKSRLWLEDHTDADVERAADSPNFWERAAYNR